MAVPDAAPITRLMIGAGDWTRFVVRALPAIGVLSVALSAGALAIGPSSGGAAHPGDQAVKKVMNSKPAPGAMQGSQASLVDPKAPEPTPPAEMSANPAVVTLSSGSLTVEANNSDLAKILRKVASISGMQIEGLNRSVRVFGRYGPGNPRDILSRLLNGSGYNFIMAGDTPDGVPRQLLLTPKSGSTQGSSPPQTQSANQAEPAPQPQNPAPEPQQMNPPATGPTKTKDTEQEREDRMQRFLQRLQKMHDGQNQDAPE